MPNALKVAIDEQLIKKTTTLASENFFKFRSVSNLTCLRKLIENVIIINQINEHLA